MNHDYALQKERDTFWQACKRCILMRQVRRYSGMKGARYFARSIVDDDDDGDDEDDNRSKDLVLEEKVDIIQGSYTEKMRLFTRLTMWGFLTNTLKIFTVLDKPRTLYNINDAQGLRPFITKWVSYALKVNVCTIYSIFHTLFSRLLLQTWSMERFYCNPSSSRYVAIIDGPGAMTRNQILSSLSCSIIGICLVSLLIISFMVWFEAGLGIILILLIFMLYVIVVHVKRVRKTVSIIFKLNKQKQEFQADDKFTAWFFQIDDDNDDDAHEREANGEEEEEGKTPDVEDQRRDETSPVSAAEGPPATASLAPVVSTIDDDRRIYLQRNASEYIEGPNIGLYILGKNMRVTEASEWLCWFMMFWEVTLFFVWPVVTLFLLRTSIIATVYMISVFISGLRHYFNIVAVIEETGTMNLTSDTSRTSNWQQQSRLSDIVDKISTDKSKKIWLNLLGCFGVIFLLLFFGGLYQVSQPSGDTTTMSKFDCVAKVGVSSITIVLAGSHQFMISNSVYARLVLPAPKI
jgi:hypothetical protein